MTTELGTALGRALGTSAGNGLGVNALFASVLMFSAGRTLTNADLYVIDGGSGKVRAVADYNAPTTHWLDQPDTTKQCALPAGHADFAGKACFNLTGAEWYLSNRAAALWNAPHEAGGFTATSVFTPLSGALTVLWATTSSSQNGLSVYQNGGALRSGLNKTSASVFDNSYGAIGSGTPTYVTIRHADAQTPDYELWRKGALAASGAYAAAPGTGAASHSLYFGNNTGSLQYVGRVRAPFMSFPLLTNDQLLAVQQYIQQDSGIAA